MSIGSFSTLQVDYLNAKDENEEIVRPNQDYVITTINALSQPPYDVVDDGKDLGGFHGPRE